MAECKQCRKPIWDIKNDLFCNKCRIEIDIMMQRDIDLSLINTTINHFRHYGLVTELFYTIWKTLKENPETTLKEAIEIANQEWLK